MTTYQGTPPNTPPDPTATAENLEQAVGETRVLEAGRRLEKTLLGLTQSARNLRTASDAVWGRSPQTSHWMARVEDRRSYQRRRIEERARSTQTVGLRDRFDLAGSLRRAWIRMVSRRGPASVLTECERSELALLGKVEEALADAVTTDVPTPIRDDLRALRKDVSATVQAIRAKRDRFLEAAAAR